MEAMLLRHFISTSPAELLMRSIWQGLLLTALAWAALKLAPGLRSATRFSLWLIVFVMVALLPCFALGRMWFGDQASAAALPQTGYAIHLNIGWAFALEAAWALASLFSLSRLFSSALAMRAVLRSSTVIADLPDELSSALLRSGQRPVSLRLSEAIDAPSVIGFFRPAVVLPRALWSELTPSELKQIIQHEIAHLDRRDDWTNLLQKLLRALYPLNPALYWAERQLCREREQACDDAVLDAAANPRAYATCLTKLAETRLVRRVTSLAPGLWQRPSELAGRVDNILHRRRRLAPLFSRGLVATGLAASLAGVLTLQRCPELISFAGPAPVGAAVEPVYQDLRQAHYQQAVFHPAESSNKNPLAPKPHTVRQVHKYRRLQFVQVSQDLNGGGITLTLFTVDVPVTSSAHQAVPTPDHWIAFQI